MYMTAKTSPPTPTIMGSTTLSTAAVATAASTALPPRMSTCRPACAASGWLVTTIPCCAMTSERLCAGQPSARAPRTALQNAGCGAGPQNMLLAGGGSGGGVCANAQVLPETITHN